MAKKKRTTIQLLPLEYLLKIGRIVKTGNDSYISKDKNPFKGNVSIPQSMTDDWRNSMNKDIELRDSTKYYFLTKSSNTFDGWTVRKDWIKP